MSKETKKNIEICKKFIRHRTENSTNLPLCLFSLMLKLNEYLIKNKFDKEAASEITRKLNDLIPYRKYINPVDLFACLMVCATFSAPYKELAEGYFTDEMIDVLGEFIDEHFEIYLDFMQLEIL